MLAFLRRIGLREGLLGGRRPWLLVGIAAWVLHLLGKALRPDAEVVYRGDLLPGETLVLAREDAPRPRRRRSRS